MRTAPETTAVTIGSDPLTIPGVDDGGFDYAEAFSRNIGLVSKTEQARLRAARIAIAGMGGVGGVHLLALARLGIGGFSLADFDRFELANMNRQAGATTDTLGLPKVQVMARAVSAINPTAELRIFPEGLDATNVESFLDGAVAAVDGIDFFNMEARRLLFRAARARGIHALTAAPVGFGATLHIFSPTGMRFDDYFDLRDGMGLPEQLLHFALGLAPKRAHRSYFPPSAVDVSSRRAPSLAPGCFLCAALVATEIANLVLRRRPIKAAPHFFQFDPLAQAYKSGRLRRGNRNVSQRAKKQWLLRTHPKIRDAV
ncbi:MAG TPA: ThiF family adenylyltransferase, partial [Methylomirabilota bacterium]|nr:ThiF family adenylyltransferase [Methylomirabilota bacterium]